ncbi:hypothetical protein [Haloarcula sp. H-GB5]
MVTVALTAAIAVGTLVIGAGLGFGLGRWTSGDDGGESGDTVTSDLKRPAERLGRPPQPDAVTDGVETLANAIDSVVDATDLGERAPIRPDDDPITRAEEVQQAAERGELVERPPEPTESPETTVDSPPEPTSEPEPVVPDALSGAVAAVRAQTTAETTAGRRLLQYLETADDVPERKLTETLHTVVTTLNRHDAIKSTLEGVTPHIDPQELARTLDRQRDAGVSGDAFGIIAEQLTTAVSEREQYESALKELTQDAERVCATANEQTVVTFDSASETPAWLSSLADQLDNGNVSFTDRESDLGSIAGRLDLNPQSTLGNDLLDLLRSPSVSQQECEGTLASAVETIDRAETTGHRLDGIDADDVARLANRLVDEFRETDSDVGSLLQERAVELADMVSQAGESDLVTVYAARQELRFYDHRLLAQLQAGSDSGSGEPDVKALRDAVEDRRSTMRTQYPSNYPQHDHSIPIHFLELVSELQEDADEAVAGGNPERAAGYLEAADKTLDWTGELYERHAYSVLLEQLRG